MYKISIFLVCLLLTAGSLKAQSFTELISVKQDEINEGYFIKRVPLQQYAVPEIKVTEAAYTSAADAKEVLPYVKQEINVKLGKDLKKPFALLYIPVYRAGSSGKAEQLVSFRLSLKEDEKIRTTSTANKTTGSNSILATGAWYKIAVRPNGIYKIDYNFIKDKLGINPATVNPANFRIYGNGGTMLSEDNAKPRYDGLQENAVQVTDDGNGSFDNNDYVLFYANGPDKWQLNNNVFEYEKNIYEDSSYYFITFDLGPGKRIGSQSSAPAPNATVTSFDDHQVYEEDLVNIALFGKEWWGDAFGTDAGLDLTKTYNFDLGTLTDDANVRVQLASRASVSNRFTVLVNGQQIDNTIYAAVNLFLKEGDQMSTHTVDKKMQLPGGNTSVTLQYTSMGSGRGYLNYIEWNTRRELGLINGMYSFRDIRSVGAGKVAGYRVKNANANTVVWDVTDALNPVRMNGNLSGSTYNFSQSADELHEFITFDGSTFRTPVFKKKVTNQNLHGAGQSDYLIVTHPDFINAANRLADHHRQQNNLTVMVVTTEQVYNEFSSGSQDISAIRDFARYFYDNAGEDTTKMPKYLLLLGDASYDYKHRIVNNTNYVPSFQTAEYIRGIFGYCSDDFFSMLDDNENSEDINIANTMDVGVGRLPVVNADEAMKVVDKIIHYSSPASLGPWRLSTTVMTDNDDGNIHYDDGEIMAKTINEHSNLYNETKVYLSALPTVSTPSGARAPDANKMINDRVDRGTFMMNYSGHGSPVTLTSERILTQDDFNLWTNLDKLPIMVTATCEFSRFDNPDVQSAGEKLMVKTDGGAIALLTTTQLVYQFLNRQMNVQYLNAQFKKQGDKWPTLGDAFRKSKNVTYINPGQYENFRKFALLGDPALTPAFPKYRVVTDSLVEGNTMLKTDSMKALGYYLLNGTVTDDNGMPLNDFNGRVYVTIYDKAKTQNTITGPNRTFEVQNNVIFRQGRATVANGRFSIPFITPKDVNYDFGKGKISYYVENGITDGAGTDTNVVIGGFSQFPIVDEEGPEVKAYINDSLFQDGGITGSNTSLFVKLYDAETGINVSGNAIGHDLTAVLDGDVSKPYILNDYYETAPNDFKRGYVNFPVNGLSDGKHSLRVKAWDMNNNSGEGVVNFIVVNGKVMEVHSLMNYPNPFTDITHFVFEHNHPNEKLDVTIRIYNTTGALVRTLQQNFTPSGSRSNEITWDGTSDLGAKLPSGLYVYRLNLSTGKGINASAYQKLILIR